MTEADDAHRAKRKTPYNERSDLEKLQAQWNKLSGLHLRDDPSAAIVRCATAVEIAANYAIRHEWVRQTEFDASIVDQFMLWANGLRGKIERLFVPIYFARPRAKPQRRCSPRLTAQARRSFSVLRGL